MKKQKRMKNKMLIYVETLKGINKHMDQLMEKLEEVRGKLPYFEEDEDSIIEGTEMIEHLKDWAEGASAEQMDSVIGDLIDYAACAGSFGRGQVLRSWGRDILDFYSEEADYPKEDERYGNELKDFFYEMAEKVEQMEKKHQKLVRECEEAEEAQA